MTRSFHISLDYAAFNLDLRRPRSAARHLRTAAEALAQEDPNFSDLPEDVVPWAILFLEALSRARYLRCSCALRQALDRVPVTRESRSTIGQLRELVTALQACDMSRSAQILRGVNEAIRRRRLITMKPPLVLSPFH